MPKGSNDLIKQRQKEIIDACEKLYRTMSFKEVTIKEIGNATSFTRTSIYNYYQTKEEIFLALLKREYELWIDDLSELLSANDQLSKDEFSDLMAKSLDKRKILLHLLSTNLQDIEENSRDEQLIEFKKVFGYSMKKVNECVDKFFPDMPEKKRREFILTFYPFIYGIYPYAVVTEKQRNAMDSAGINFTYLSVYDIAYMGTRMLLGN